MANIVPALMAMMIANQNRARMMHENERRRREEERRRREAQKRKENE